MQTRIRHGHRDSRALWADHSYDDLRLMIKTSAKVLQSFVSSFPMELRKLEVDTQTNSFGEYPISSHEVIVRDLSRLVSHMLNPTRQHVEPLYLANVCFMGLVNRASTMRKHYSERLGIMIWRTLRDFGVNETPSRDSEPISAD